MASVILFQDLDQQVALESTIPANPIWIIQSTITRCSSMQFCKNTSSTDHSNFPSPLTQQKSNKFSGKRPQTVCVCEVRTPKCVHTVWGRTPPSSAALPALLGLLLPCLRELRVPRAQGLTSRSNRSQAGCVGDRSPMLGRSYSS